MYWVDCCCGEVEQPGSGIKININHTQSLDLVPWLAANRAQTQIQTQTYY